ncbi:low molecular weight protein arginine phosphatase [Paenibacillus antri]|uniref:Low molecular weight protein arginine phosphatase n=1 Tax=Paenibacillus antri TaxID=2582848 RepID=A0A5R9G2C4_9BACL|nr:low molecular weight protein arginine phosphatase [Paenibacillus antri]TLS50507.1 low molecular weight protein arginine phosphatase [Paenibacillus antri]
MKRILLVCTGNTCRSPMAEALFRKRAAARGVPVEVKSAGVAAVPGQPMSGHAADVLRERGVDPSGFRSSEATPELVRWADLILTMTSHHKRHLLELYPDAVEKTFALKEYAGGDPETAALFAERESLAAELQMRLALGQQISNEEREKLYELDRRLPNPDVQDPIGGSRARYEKTADEIETAIAAALDRLYSE